MGRDFGHGVVLGAVGYDYRQLSDDTGAGVPAILNGFKGEVDAVGPGLTYTTQIGKVPFILNARQVVFGVTAKGGFKSLCSRSFAPTS